MKTSTLTLIYRDCSNCGQMTVTSSLCMRPDLCPPRFGTLLSSLLRTVTPCFQRAAEWRTVARCFSGLASR